MKKKNLYKHTELPLYLRLSETREGSNRSLICVLKSDKHQTDEYNRRKFYKPALLNYVQV